MKKMMTGMLLLAIALPGSAASLGTWGDTWDIREHDLIAVMKNNLQQHFAGQSPQALQQEMQKQAEAGAMRPPPVEGLITSQDTHTRLFDPTFTVTRDIADDKGAVFARKGQQVNPFDIIPVFNETLYFIDGDDERQLAWMKAQQTATAIRKIILVNGNVRDSAVALGEQMFFDQTGTLTRKFGIRQVPARVMQAPGQKLFSITEYGLPDR
ncbi:type-F conjugative transfer system protein TraW [Pantoea sp. BAV 3049]|uniref:type-F conjugative transfer system protein TraW n=1 Tax=Pantoea sp. BAV 3049 TaxID=2654188 RepID=UPI00131AC092|nr:type-F conjugative transfer system protein TraW [Pantoea sp. BAV 3049]